MMAKEAITRTDAMVNMDTLGLASTEVATGISNKKLTRALAYIAQKLNFPVTGVDVGAIGTTDSESFATRKIPSITIHSLTQQAWDMGILHSPMDRLSVIRMDDYYQTYLLLSAYLNLLDLVLPSSTNTGSH
jgi:putative aminopeptidase FrvX